MNIVRHRPIVFTVVSLLVISFVYSSISTSGIFALPPDPNWDPGGTCGAETTNPETGQHKQTCCWKETERGPYPKIGTREVTYCQTCTWASLRDCGSKVAQGPPLGSDLPTAETVPPNRTLPGDVGDLPTLEQVPGPGLSQGTEGEPPLPVVCSTGLELDVETGQCVPIEPGGLPQLEQVPPNGILPGGGNLPTLEQGPGLTQGTEGEPPLPVVCSEEAGLEKDPETGQCVPIEAPVTEEQPEEAPEEEPEEEQTEPEEEQPAEESGSGDGSNN